MTEDRMELVRKTDGAVAQEVLQLLMEADVGSCDRRGASRVICGADDVLERA